MRPGARRWPWIVGGVVVALLLFFAIFDWNWLRGPAERFASRAMARPVSIGHLDVRLHRLTPNVVLSDVTLGNADWVGPQPMARAKEVVFEVALPTLLTREIDIPHLRLKDANVAFVRDAEGRANWHFREKGEARRNVRVLTLAVDDARVTLRDAMNHLTADLHAVAREEGRYATRIDFRGKWRDGPFEGTADTGSVLSLRGSMQPFPIRLVGKAGATSIRAEGEVADITRFRRIDAQVAISGPTLASLYTVLKVALPDTPPYQSSGHLKRDGDTYSYEEFKGTIGSTDIGGSAIYELRQPRPMLTADLRSQKLDIADLGPLIGARTGAAQTDVSSPGGGSARAEPAPAGNDAAGSAHARKAAARAGQDGRLLPDRPFNLEKLNAMDADVRLAATRLRIPGQIPLHDFGTRARLDRGVLTLEPLNFGFAGGDVVARIVLDASQQPLAGRVAADFKRVRLKQLFPSLDKLKESGGSLGAQVRLNGRGNTVAALLGSSNGSITAGMARGRVSEIAVWLVNLNGGELIPLLFGGDRPTPIRCAAAALDVRNGVGSLDTFVFDTEESRITGGGGVDLKNERVDITLRPVAKKAGLLSIRGPIHIQGPFGAIHFAVAPQSLARGLGAVALGIVNPILALLPLVETGPGEDTDCRAVLEPVRSAVQQSGKSVKDAPAAGEKEKGRGEASAPIVNIPAGNATTGEERESRAPAVDAATKP